MSATFIVVASKHAVGTKLRNSLVDDFYAIFLLNPFLTRSDLA